MAINLAEKYHDKLDQAFTRESYTKAWVRHDYEFLGVDTIKVYTLTSQPLTDYNRTGTGDRYGGNNELQDTVATYTLTKDRSFKVALDKGNVAQTGKSRSAGKVLKLQMTEQYAPEYDKLVLKKAYDAAVANSQTITFDETRALDGVMSANAKLSEEKAPMKGRVIMMTPSFHKAVKAEIVKDTQAVAAATKILGQGVIGMIDGIPAVEVPTSYFEDKVEAIVWHKDALLGADQVEETRVIENSENVSGSLVLGRFIFDAFAMEAKKKAIVAIVKA